MIKPQETKVKCYYMESVHKSDEGKQIIVNG